MEKQKKEFDYETFDKIWQSLEEINLYIMCGVPGSGKTTWLANHKKGFAQPMEIISRDAIRFSYLKDGDDYFKYEKEVWNDFILAIQNALVTKRSIFVDATHLNEKSRAKLLRALGNSLANEKIKISAIVMNTSLEEILKRNAGRTGRAFVPEDAIRAMYASFTDPTFEEGFSTIFIVHENGNITIKKEE